MTIYTFKPTFLYIKRHSVTGKLYFGKTIGDPEKYLGSGRRWKYHIRKHGIEHVENLWYCLFLDQKSCTEFALNFSEQQNIVESDEWLNEIPENGLDGMRPGSKHSESTKRKISESNIGRKMPESAKQKISKARAGKELSDEHKRKLSDAKQNVTEETKAKISASRRGKLNSEEQKSKISARLSGRVLSEETRQKMSKPKSPEHIANMRKPRGPYKKKTLDSLS